jgi:hypothetical protein
MLEIIDVPPILSAHYSSHRADIAAEGLPPTFWFDEARPDADHGTQLETCEIASTRR